jgi:hypothetical protein
MYSNKKSKYTFQLKAISSLAYIVLILLLLFVSFFYIISMMTLVSEWVAAGKARSVVTSIFQSFIICSQNCQESIILYEQTSAWMSEYLHRM